MLSERERRVLGDIERELCSTDPRLARALRGDAAERARWTRTACSVVGVVASLSALVCVALLLIVPAVLAVALAEAAFLARRFDVLV